MNKEINIIDVLTDFIQFNEYLENSIFLFERTNYEGDIESAFNLIDDKVKNGFNKKIENKEKYIADYIKKKNLKQIQNLSPLEKENLFLDSLIQNVIVTISKVKKKVYFSINYLYLFKAIFDFLFQFKDLCYHRQMEMNKIFEKFEDEIRELKLFKETQINENKELKLFKEIQINENKELKLFMEKQINEIKELKLFNESQKNENAELKKEIEMLKMKIIKLEEEKNKKKTNDQINNQEKENNLLIEIKEERIKNNENLKQMEIKYQEKIKRIIQYAQNELEKE